MRYFRPFPGLVAAIALAASLGQAPLAYSATPTLKFWALDTSLAYEERAQLRWESSGTTRCEATEGWLRLGERKRKGQWLTRALTEDTRFTLKCFGSGTSVQKSVFINVAGDDGDPTDPVKPTLTLKANTNAVQAGEDVTLTWAGEGVSDCLASGGWSGSRNTSGTQVQYALSKSVSFTLTCASPTGNVMAMTSVTVTSGGTELSWQPPDERVDGSALNALSGYRIYVGTISGNYYDEVPVNDESKTSHFLSLVPGEYYLAMTAIDMDGNESPLSNEIRRTVE
jgi:hypothetical protein